jgi:hypothetical protein
MVIVPGGGNRQLRLRLPSDHWVWQIGDPAARRAEARRALDFYHRFHGRFEEVTGVVAEIREMLRKGASGAAPEHSRSGQEGDARLFAALDKFLDF